MAAPGRAAAGERACGCGAGRAPLGRRARGARRSGGAGP
ncbi:hypothetical protein L810_7660 [Burkholderia sp. AU4i]|nr:hypothetical protein L810_7660 [Burkholderia sp. AU4i]